METDLTFVYILLWFTAIGSCSGPSSHDIEKLNNEIKTMCTEKHDDRKNHIPAPTKQHGTTHI